MKINDVLILNWKAPVDQWWDNVQAKPSEATIKARIEMLLSWDEYVSLLANDSSCVKTPFDGQRIPLPQESDEPAQIQEKAVQEACEGLRG